MSDHNEHAIIPIVTIYNDTSALERAGQAANEAARKGKLERYQERKSDNTLRRQGADVALFETYLQEAHVPATNMAMDLANWRGVTHGLIDGWIMWMLEHEYSTGSINVRLSTIKTYCTLASQAGHLGPGELALIKSIKGYRPGEDRFVNRDRAKRGKGSRRPGAKKQAPLEFGKAQEELLKQQPDTPRGRRDLLFLCLILDHGLRAGELKGLDRGSIDLERGTIEFFREKVGLTQIHDLTPDTWMAARAYIADIDPEGNLNDNAPLFPGTVRSKDGRYSTRSLNDRLRVLGVPLGLLTLSPHDGRHHWATRATRGGTDIKSLQDAGGWSSPAMPLRYAASEQVANKGVKLT